MITRRTATAITGNATRATGMATPTEAIKTGADGRTAIPIARGAGTIARITISTTVTGIISPGTTSGTKATVISTDPTATMVVNADFWLRSLAIRSIQHRRTG